MGHVLLSLAEFVLALGAIGVFLVVALVLGLGLAAKAVARMFGCGPQAPAHEAAVASEKTIQQLQQKLQALEAERAPGVVSARR